MTLAKGSGAVSPNKIQDATKANKVALNSGSNKIEFTTNSVLNATLDSDGTLSLGTSSGAVGIEVVRSSASTDFGLKLKNSANGDIKLTLETAAQSYSFGVDNSDNDYLKLSTSSTDVGSSTLWTIKPDGKLGLLTVPTSTLHVAGSIAQTITTLTSATTLDGTHSLVHVNATSGTVNISLPTSVGISGRSYIIMKTDASVNTVVIDGNASETISGDLTLTLTGQYDWVTLRSDGANWIIEGSNNLSNSSICLDSGTLSALPLNFCTDTNTGLYNPAADSLSLVTGGISRIDIINGSTSIRHNLNVDGSIFLIAGSRYKINSVDVLSSTTLGAGVINSSLTSVGTLNFLTVDGNIDIGTASSYKVNNTSVLTGTTLGSGVINSSLTSVGTLSSLVVSGTEHIGGATFIGATSGTAITNLHIKTGTSGISAINVNGALIESAGNGALTVATPNTSAGYMMFADPQSSIAGVIKYNHNNDTMSFFTNATERVYISSTGLGIGGSPSSRLTIKNSTGSGTLNVQTGTTTADSVRLEGGGSVTNWLEYRGFLGHVFFNDTTEAMRLDSTGLGIGVTSPLGKLHVKQGTSGVSSAPTFADGVVLEDSSDTGFSILTPNTGVGTISFSDPEGLSGRLQYDHATDNMYFYTLGSVRTTITSSGNVGIGTTSPSSKLEVVGSASDIGYPASLKVHSGDDSSTIWRSALKIVHASNTTIVSGSSIGLSFDPLASTGSSYYGSASIKAVRENAVANNQDTALAFSTRAGASNNTTDTEKLRITSTGNVGIGTTNPGTKLDVNGPIALKAPSTVNASNYTVVATDSSLRFTTTNCTVTLPTASSFTGRILYMNTITANSVDSASSNVIPLGSDTAGTAILAATAGKFTMLQSNGTNWITMMSN